MTWREDKTDDMDETRLWEINVDSKGLDDGIDKAFSSLVGVTEYNPRVALENVDSKRVEVDMETSTGVAEADDDAKSSDMPLEVVPTILLTGFEFVDAEIVAKFGKEYSRWFGITLALSALIMSAA